MKLLSALMICAILLGEVFAEVIDTEHLLIKIPDSWTVSTQFRSPGVGEYHDGKDARTKTTLMIAHRTYNTKLTREFFLKQGKSLEFLEGVTVVGGRKESRKSRMLKEGEIPEEWVTYWFLFETDYVFLKFRVPTDQYARVKPEIAKILRAIATKPG